MNRRSASWQRAMYLTSHPSFKAAMAKLRRRYQIPARGFNSYKKYEAWAEKLIYKTSKGNALAKKIERDIAGITANQIYKLSPSWNHAIERYLYFNRIDRMQLPAWLDSHIVQDQLSGQPVIHLMIGADVSKEEYIDGWDDVKRKIQQYGLPARGKEKLASVYLLKRKKFAYEMWLKTKSYTRVASAVEKRFAKELANDAYTPDVAKTDINNFMKQAGIPSI